MGCFLQLWVIKPPINHGLQIMPLFKRDPTKKLKKAYQQKMEAAMHAMRRGDVRGNAMLVQEAEAIRSEIERLETSSPAN